MKRLSANKIAFKLLLSLPLLGALSLSLQQYQVGLLEKKTNKLFPMLANLDLFSFSPVLNRYIDHLETQDALASQRHWQRGLLYEWQGGKEKLDKAQAAIAQAIEQRPGWPLMWRDRMRIGWKQELSVEERTQLLRKFRRVGDWNRQSVAALTKLYLPRWNELGEEEKAWLAGHVPKVIGVYQWVEETKLLVALKLLPEDLCTGIDVEPEVLEGCEIDLSNYVNSL